MGGYLAYTEYKDSGVEWLGTVPAHWDVKRAKYMFLLQRGYDLSREDMEEGEYPVCASNGVIGHHISFNVKAPSITVGRSGSVGEINYIESNFWAHNTALFVKYFFDSFPRFVYYLLSTLDIKHLSFGTAVGTLNRNHIHRLLIGIPPLEEQQSIARFLDYKTAQIDALIAKKEALLEKLAEKRTALISQAVTKGCDRTVPMKDSGVEWLGEIPRHWKVGALGYFCQITSGGTPDRNNPEYWNGDIPWIKTGEINYQDIYEAEEHISAKGLLNSPANLAEPGTLLIAMYGQGNTRGRVAILRIKAAFNQACLAISPHQNLNVKFLYYYLIAAYQYIRDFGNESSQMNLSAGMISKIKFLMTSLEEQQNIVLLLDRETYAIEQQQVKQAIAKLKEYRTALITNAVTGKIDVRDIKIPELESMKAA